MLKFIFTTAFSMLSICSYCQYTISGNVTDVKTHQPLSGTSIRMQELKRLMIADQFGNFRFDNVPQGEYVLSITYIGYEGKTEKIKVSGDVELTIALETNSIITDAVVVSATRATDKTPTTFSSVTKENIQKQNFGQDVPFLINWTPSVVTTSDAGTGIGYTGIRIRGSDATRINVTINGIPYNDSESLGTFWVDIPDIASSSQSIQIQRGVGTSTNGAGAFGASINLQTNTKNDEPYAQVINSIGSFNSRKHTIGFGTGMLNNHWIFEGRVSKISSDGFIDRATADLKSYYFTGGYYTKNTVLKSVLFGGKERTYQAWYGVPESKINNDVEAMKGTVINEGWNEIQTQNLLNSNDRTFNPYLYKNQVDDYQQDHYQLHFSHQLSEALTWNTSLHYTPGKGYYEEYRYKDEFENYGLSPVTIGDSVIASSDLIRRRWLDNDFYGLTYSLNFDKNYWNVILGGGWNRYDGDHFGQILWAEVSPVDTEYQYYFNNGDKRDLNTFLKINYAVTSSLNAYVDLQFRKISYRVSGIENKQEPININADFNFFNPKAGLTYSISDRQQLYGSFAVAHREPLRDDFINFTGKPKAETLRNLEVGFRNTGKNHVFNGNYYLMDYKNQLVLTGEINDVGAPVRTNAGLSYRMGVELEAAFRLSKRFQWNANLTISKNKVKSYTEVIENYGENFDEFSINKFYYKNTDISFSPHVIAGSQFSYHPFINTEFTLLTKYVGKQYLDNTQREKRSIQGYLINDIRLSYTWKTELVKEIAFSILINNILNEKYSSNGYTWGYLAGATAYRENYYYPQAGRNLMAMIALKF